MIMRKNPNRPVNEVSQSFNDGFVRVYTVIDVAEPGYSPKKSLSQKIRLNYQERTYGITRLYTSRQNQVEIKRVIRCQRRPDVSSQDIAITEDGAQYEIDAVNPIMETYPPCMDLTLKTVKQKYEVPS